jgi:hypothetical protein
MYIGRLFFVIGIIGTRPNFAGIFRSDQGPLKNDLPTV